MAVAVAAGLRASTTSSACLGSTALPVLGYIVHYICIIFFSVAHCPLSCRTTLPAFELWCLIASTSREVVRAG